MTRAFVAIRPPHSVLDAIEARVASSAMSRGRATARDQWHLTVQFLGNDADLAAVATTFELEPLDLGAGEIRLGGADALGPRRRARILALGQHEGAEWTAELAAQIERRLAPLGHVRDVREKGFRPHLTLARFREPTDLRPLCAAIGPDPVGHSWRVDKVVLYESVLRPQGAQHVARAHVPTGPGGPRDDP
ncbi:MAG: RNA 2',3'-cyclic phosphodiesterase [Actinomycetota bacterium]|nr:RNA 2',3'-cyclic phosphodiesterase [Actinomycetota bacterium]